MSHDFRLKSFYKPAYCNYCTDLLWGIMNQGYQCTVCNAISHDRCLMESRKMSCTVKSGGYRPLNFISNNKIKDPLTAAVKTGHEFKVKSYYKPTYCHQCSELLWGLMNQGYQCTVCNFVCHERCLSSLTVDCTHLLSEQITNPIGHTWISPKSSANKRKWCNVCRKKITGSAMYCKVCRRYAHKYCIGHELNNCKECSSTCTTKTDFDHHWIEGNLTSHAKCEMCTKPCFTDLCLTGFRCGWCGITLHSSCFNAFIKSDKCKSCDFRDLSHMILPPYCVSMPISQRTLQQDETLEAISSTSFHITVVPTINEEMLGDAQEPVLVFINGRSGGNQGIELINGFSRHLNPLQVYDLSAGGPLPGLYSFRNVSKYRVLVGGGDGTVGWVLSGLDFMKDHLKCPVPPCAVLPLGTGNDLARALKWGGGYTGEKVMQLLYAIEDADRQPFDRWNVKFKEDFQLISEAEGAVECKTVTMNNYLGIGLDAEIALDFHQAREDHPEKFNSRLHNKGVYLQLGVQKTFSRDTSAELHQVMALKVDDKFVSLPTGLKGIVLLNIESWGAGSEPWGSHIEEGFEKNTYSDGMLEVMGLSGPMHLGRIKSSLQNGIRIAQGTNISISFSSTLPVQVDGEAWQQTPCEIEVNLLEQRAIMLRKSPNQQRPSSR
uniref:Diacylglycerol kinase n=1 Tax=Amphimedon queenslandica TaxID=400682 RepID=A0A1X7V9D8_AMPQE